MTEKTPVISEDIRIPQEVVEEAHARAEGTHHIGDYHVIKDKKLMLIGPKEPTLGKEFAIIAFPKKEDIARFKEAMGSMVRKGPADYNPGAIGTLMIKRPTEPHSPLEFVFMQSHFKTGGAKGYRGEVATPLPRALATKYGGWRVRALKQAAEIAADHGTEFEVEGHHLFFSKSLEDALNKLRENGIEMKDRRDGGRSIRPIRASANKRLQK